MQVEARYIRAAALAAQLRATPIVIGAASSVATLRILAEAAVVALTAAVNAPTIALGVQAQFIRAAALTGQFIKLLRPMDEVALNDQTSYHMARALEDITAIADLATVAYSKPVADAFTVSDQALAEVIKALSDTVGIADVKVISVGKALNEALALSDPMGYRLSTARADKILYREGPGIDDYALGYFLEDYGYDGKPVFNLIKPRADAAALTDAITDVHFTKGLTETPALTDTLSRFIRRSISDQIFATDDFLGVANVDDDQVMSLRRGVSDAFVVGDTFARVVYFVRDFTDSAALTDSATQRFGKTAQDTVAFTDPATVKTSKPLADAFAATDSAAKSTAKAFADAGALADATTKSANKALADAGALTDSSIARTAKVLTDAGALTDSKAASLSKPAADSAAATDAATKSVGQNKTDSAALTDSGSARMQSYCDITYFATDYVGILFTF